ncbi:unnamed protein product, partial [Pleuronectes platessa]
MRETDAGGTTDGHCDSGRWEIRDNGVGTDREAYRRNGLQGVRTYGWQTETIRTNERCLSAPRSRCIQTHARSQDEIAMNGVECQGRARVGQRSADDGKTLDRRIVDQGNRLIATDA